MMSRIELLWSLFDRSENRAAHEEILQRLLDLQTDVNVLWLKSHPRAPGIYDSGIRYAAEGRFKEVWQSVGVILSGDVADCEDLACWRAAELRVTGEDSAARATFYSRQLSRSRRLYHVIVLRGDGSTEDPSRALGMGSRSA